MTIKFTLYIEKGFFGSYKAVLAAVAVKDRASPSDISPSKFSVRWNGTRKTGVSRARQALGDPSEGVPPVPIPNTVVKPLSPDGTARESAWESRTSPK